MKKWTIRSLGVILASLCFVAQAGWTLEDNVTCKKCGVSVGISICLLVDADEQGFENCQSGTICVSTVNGPYCLTNSCYSSATCIRPPGFPQ